ncbi:MAG: DNA alkylation repair protein [Anaerolineae bacterium]|jgi:hypothetical protein
MRAEEARDLGRRLAECVRTSGPEDAYALLGPVLARRTPFAKLGLIGKAVGREPLDLVNAFLDRIAATGAEGGWVVIGAVLSQQLNRDLQGALERCRAYVIASGVWYGTDILAERVPGPALVTHFESALRSLLPWREDENVWVRRAVGVAVHFWAKRSRSAEELVPRARLLLRFLGPMFEEWEMPAVKGVGWGLKTLGRYYPDLLADWLTEEIVPSERHHRALMLRKALAYLSESQRARVAAA